MTRKVRSVTPETSLKDVAAMLSVYGIGGMPVVDERQRPLGVITKADIVIKERAEVPRRGISKNVPTRRQRRDRGQGESANGRRGDERTCEHDRPDSVVVCCRGEDARGRRESLARGRWETLVGIITRHDLVSAFARSDAELEREIREDALANVSWPGALDVIVRNGEVTMRGQVDSLFDASALPIEVRHILGVVSVDSELTAWDPHRERKVAISTHV